MGIHAVTQFYLHGAPTPAGLTLSHLLNRGKWWHPFGYRLLETDHAYIQWLFPTSTPSAFNLQAPTISQRDVRKLDTQTLCQLQKRLRSSLQLMLGFYGIKQESDGTMTRNSSYQRRFSVWLTPNNHNLLRVTRILSSLKLLGLHAESRELLTILQDIASHEGQGILSSKTLKLWQQAAPSQGLFSWLLSIVNP